MFYWISVLITKPIVAIETCLCKTTTYLDVAKVRKINDSFTDKKIAIRS